jgi:hypothetical protein
MLQMIIFDENNQPTNSDCIRKKTLEKTTLILISHQQTQSYYYQQ